jgi:hypothetical protein
VRHVSALAAQGVLLVGDPHLWALTLFDELQPLGFRLSCPSLTRLIRRQKLRPACPACARATGRANAVIEHPPGEETQWDWLDLPDPPAHLPVLVATLYRRRDRRGHHGVYDEGCS